MSWKYNDVKNEALYSLANFPGNVLWKTVNALRDSGVLKKITEGISTGVAKVLAYKKEQDYIDAFRFTLSRLSIYSESIHDNTLFWKLQWIQVHRNSLFLTTFPDGSVRVYNDDFSEDFDETEITKIQKFYDANKELTDY